MNKSQIVGELRATIFVSPIVYDPQNLQRINEILKPEDGYMPNLVQQQVLPPGFPLAMVNDGAQLEWEMASRKTNLRVHFGPQKIDIIQSTHTEKEGIDEKVFCQICSSIFSSIIQRFSLVPTRLAFAPTYTPEFDKILTRNSFIDRIYSAKEFGGSKMNTILFKHGYTVEEIIGQKSFKLNYVADASEGHSIKEIRKPDGTVEVKINNMLNLALDINTRQGVGYSFSVEEMLNFFEKAPEFANKFFDYYVNIS